MSAKTDTDISKLDGKTHLTTSVASSSINIKKPDGLPCVADWVTCCISYIFNGSRLRREPLDLNVAKKDNDADPVKYDIKKGFTRLTPGQGSCFLQYVFFSF